MGKPIHVWEPLRITEAVIREHERYIELRIQATHHLETSELVGLNLIIGSPASGDGKVRLSREQAKALLGFLQEAVR